MGDGCIERVCELPSVRVTDLLLFRSTECPVNCRRSTVDGDFTKSVTASQFDTSKLVELLRQSAVEHLTSFRQLEAQIRGLIGYPVTHASIATTEFDALYAYKFGEYERCLLLAGYIPNTEKPIYMYPELIQLLDDDLASLVGLMSIIKPHREYRGYPASISQLVLSLYLVVQCRKKLNVTARHPHVYVLSPITMFDRLVLQYLWVLSKHCEVWGDWGEISHES